MAAWQRTRADADVAASAGHKLADRRHAGVLEAPPEIVCGKRRGLGPALDRDEPVARVDADGHLSGIRPRGLAHEVGIAHGGGADEAAPTGARVTGGGGI